MISARLARRLSSSVYWQMGQWQNQSTFSLSASLVGKLVRFQPQCGQMVVSGGGGIGMYHLYVVRRVTVPQQRDRWRRGIAVKDCSGRVRGLIRGENHAVPVAQATHWQERYAAIAG